jgi:hypothetical protein
MRTIISPLLLSLARTQLRRAPAVPAPLALGAGLVVGAGLVFLIQRRRRHDQAEAAVEERGPVTQAVVPTNPSDAPIGAPGRNLDDRLDEALEESFPASDPVSVHIE